MAKSSTNSGNSPKGTTAGASPADVLLEIDFTKPFENFARKIGDQASTTQRAPPARTLVELLPELIQIRNSIPKWRAAIEEIPGIQRNPAEQMQRLEDLNYAVQQRSALLQRHRALLTQNDLLASDGQYSYPPDHSVGLLKFSANGQKR